MTIASTSYDRMTQIRKRALQNFGEHFAYGVIRRWVRRVLRRPIQLQFLGKFNPDAYTHTRLERNAIDLDRIVGTSGRSDRFDDRFFPMQPRSKDRWVSVAIGSMADPMGMPPIEVVQVGDDYYVIDGHHRVSVARSLRKAFIDANITQWEPLA
jgi:hypothetical protein